MKLFGANRSGTSREGGLFKTRWFGRLVTLCGVLIVVAVCIEAYRRAANYGAHVVEARPVNARIEIHNPPAWLDRRIINSLLETPYAFAQRDEATYNRTRNVLDNDVLREIADLYTGTDDVDGKTVSRQSKGFNAWIKRVTEVRRNIAKDHSVQTIEISAEWRVPAAWVRVGNMLYLIDADGVRLPGDYPLGDRVRSKLMVLTGVQLPEVDGEAVGTTRPVDATSMASATTLPAGNTGEVPEPGERWTAGRTGKLGEDMAAGMKMIAMLQHQPFVSQIDAIDLANFGGRRNALAAWIVLDTIWPAADGSPRVVQWGRPAGEEKFFEVQASAKMKSLNELYLRFKRIDAGRDYVDIRTEVLKLPKVASQLDVPVPQMVRE